MIGQALAIGLLAAAGAALAAQNLLMAGSAARVSSPLIPLALNSAVGLALLGGLLAAQGALPDLRAAAGALGWRGLAPGVLGTFFVFASLAGYRSLGAAPTIAILVASQLVCGLAADMIAAAQSGAGRDWTQPLIGAALLAAGAVLVGAAKG